MGRENNPIRLPLETWGSLSVPQGTASNKGKWMPVLGVESQSKKFLPMYILAVFMSIIICLCLVCLFVFLTRKRNKAKCA